MKDLFLTMLLSAGTLLAAGELTDAEWAAMKQKAVNRPGRIVANHDGCDVTAWPRETIGDITLDKFYSCMLNNFIGGKVTTLSYCPYGVGLALCVPTKVGEYLPPSAVLPDCRNVTDWLLKTTGKDVMQLSMEFARGNGMEFFGAMRVNDTHDMHFSSLLLDWKKSNPELMVGSADKRPPRGEWTALDYARPEVCDRLVDVVTELMENYEVDGFELDFCRMPLFFKSVAWNKPVSQEEMDRMTDAIRRIRANAERIGRARKRPIVLLFHLIDSPVVCREMGLDVERWMREGLFDIYAGGSDRGNYNIAGDLAAICEKYGVKYYAGVIDPYSFSGVFDRGRLPALNGVQAAQLAGGASGTYLFNLHYQAERMQGFVPTLDELKFADKTYFVAHQHENNYGVQPESYRKFNKIPELSPWKEFCGAIRKDYIIQVGDDFNDSALTALDDNERPRAVLYLDVRGDVDKLKVLLNGVALRPGNRTGTVVEYPVELAVIRRGVNTLTLDATAADGTMAGYRQLMDGTRFPTDIGRPWWPVWLSGEGTKLIEDGAFRLNDNISSPDGKVNQLRTLSGLGGVPVKLEFDLKTFDGNAPESAMLRLADGRNIEIIDFQPKRIKLSYTGKSVPFTTSDGFHRYSVFVDNGKLTLLADGKALMRNVALKTKVNTPRHNRDGAQLSRPR